MKDVECYYCHKYGHMQANCFKKQRESNQVSYTEEVPLAEEKKLFLVCTSEEVDATTI